MGGLSHPNSCGLAVIMIFASTTYPLPLVLFGFGSSNSSINARTAAYATMPPNQDRHEVSLDLVTIAGTEKNMQANLTQYEDVAELEDDILCFLPTVSDLDVFGCELDLLDLHTQQPLPEAFRTALLQRPQLQIVVRPCMVEGHSIWQFQEDGRESYPKAVRVFFFHEYGRRVGMVPRSSLKGGKNSLMVEKRTRKPNTTQNKQPKAHRPSLHHHAVFPLC